MSKKRYTAEEAAEVLTTIHLFLINNPFLTVALEIVSVFLKNLPKKLFSNCLIDGL